MKSISTINPAITKIRSVYLSNCTLQLLISEKWVWHLMGNSVEMSTGATNLKKKTFKEYLLTSDTQFYILCCLAKYGRKPSIVPSFEGIVIALYCGGLDYMFLHLKMMNYSQNNVFESSIQLLCKFGTEKSIMFSD